ncbi:MAG: ATP-binding protein, partial [Candidatus Ornithospirochaeta sp.]|nr:ATP-binding protein [Candidatus Ornithospirochaeta sp.]
EGLEREVASFLNTNGGELLIGVNNDGTVYGVDDVDAAQTKIAQRLDSNIKPSCLGLFDIHVERRADKRIIKVVVSAGYERPYYLAKYGMTPKGCYYRVGA